MPRAIDSGAGDPIGIEDLAEALDAAPFDPRDEDDFAARGTLLARLGRNRVFLADLAITELKARCAGQINGNSYGPQVIMLRPPNRRYVLRANFWPAAQDDALRSSGPAAFFYDMPHDHNFSFLTIGYLGPGYRSDYYEPVDATHAGLPGEEVPLRFVERSHLTQGRVLLYRAHRDIHVQTPPDSLSISLNILANDPSVPWRTQYRFDVERDAIAAPLTVSGVEALLELAVGMGMGNGFEVADSLARSHPIPRVRLTAWRALASVDAAVWTEAANDPAALVARSARLALGERSDPGRPLRAPR